MNGPIDSDIVGIQREPRGKENVENVFPTIHIVD